MALSARLDQGGRPDDSTREAIRVLHQGLARLTNQVATTTGNSAHQLALLTSYLEELAGRVGQVSADSEDVWRMLERRLSNAEKAAQFHVNALGQVLDKVEIGANLRAADRLDSQRSTTKHEESLRQLESMIARLASRTPGVELEHRINNIERLAGDIVDKLTGYEARNTLDVSVQAVAFRLEALEKHIVSLTEARARELQDCAVTPREAQVSIEPPPVITLDPSENSSGRVGAKDVPAWELPPAFAKCIFDPKGGVEPENFPAQARRSARATPTAWGTTNYVIPLIGIPIVILIVVAAYNLVQPAKVAGMVVSSDRPTPDRTSYSVNLPTPPKNDATKFVVAPQVTVSADTDRDVSGRPVLRKEGVPLRAATLQHEGHNERYRPIPRGALSKQSKQAHLDRLARMANSGNANALTILGLRGADGDAAISPSDAVRFLTQAAQKGQAVAQYRLGTLYERGEGVPADGVQAAHWYELAANQGNRKAMHNLAVLYAAGAQGNKNMALAASWFSKAALLGLSDAQFNLAVLYERGDGVRQSLQDAYKWYSIAAASGDVESKSRINVVQTQLNDTDKATGNKLAAAFRPAPLDRRANVPPDIADLKD